MTISLTKREEQILHCIADGFENREIGIELGIATDTVKGHVQRLLPKMKARNRAHAVALAYHYGILTSTTDKRDHEQKST